MEQPLKKHLPLDMRDLLTLLNATHIWNTTVYVFDRRIEIFDGDQPLFYAQTMAEAEAFLIGCFLGTFPGKDLKKIRRDIALGKYEEVFSDEAIEMIEREHVDYVRQRMGKQQAVPAGDESGDSEGAEKEDPSRKSVGDSSET